MSYNLFQDILKELNYKLNYDAVVNFAGNSFCEKAWDMIQEGNPMLIKEGQSGGGKAMNDLVSLINKSNVKVRGKDNEKG